MDARWGFPKEDQDRFQVPAELDVQDQGLVSEQRKAFEPRQATPWSRKSVRISVVGCLPKRKQACLKASAPFCWDTKDLAGI